jgi:hypothetical protein
MLNARAAIASTRPQAQINQAQRRQGVWFSITLIVTGHHLLPGDRLEDRAMGLMPFMQRAAPRQ